MTFSQYAPVNETQADLWLERSYLDGAQLAAMAYGILVTIFIQCVAALWSPPNGKRNWALLCYTCLMFTLGSFGNVSSVRLNELSFIDARNFPGGLSAFMGAEYNYWVNAAGSICFVIASWFQDGLVMYRLWVIWNRSYKIIVLPAIMLLGAVVMSCFLMFQLTQPGGSLWTTANFALPYWCLSIALNIICTGLIVGCLLFLGNEIRAVLGVTHAIQYTSISAMLIESAALNSITGMVFIISYARNSNVQHLFLPALGQIESISPLLIIMRVAHGRAWSKSTNTIYSTARVAQWNRSMIAPVANPGSVPKGDIESINVASDPTTGSKLDFHPHTKADAI